MKTRHAGVFTPGWWGKYGPRPGHLPARAHPWHPWRHWNRWNHRPHYWWRWASAATLTRWFVGRPWGAAIYYDYGVGGNFYYDNDMVYIDGQEVCSAEEYAEQAYQIAEALPEVPEEQEVEWMPLGVFALTNQDKGEPDMMLQLAVSKEGIIAGSYFNTTTETTLPIEGSVDRETQRAAWTVVNDKGDSPVMECGIYNLTQDETTVLVHFGKDTTQQWLLVRMPEQEDSQE